MAHSEQIPDNQLRNIARQIADRAPRRALFLADSAAPVRLGESFPMWMLPAEAVAATRDIAEAAVQTDSWHHQVRAAQGAVTFARSTVSDGSWLVGEVARSGLEADIETTIRWIDENIPQDLEARLLMAPAYYLTALWLHGDNEDHVVVAQAPAALATIQRNIDYPAAEFLARLADQRPSAGVPPLPEES